MKKIALDLDGVVFDSENLYRVYSEIYDVDVNKKDSIIDNEQRTFQKRYNWGENECKKFYEEYANKVLSSANFMTGAEIVLPKLREKYELIVITSRTEWEVSYAIEKFKLIDMDNIQIFFNEKSKIEKLKSENCDYIIDDDIQICNNASKENITAINFKNAASSKIEETKYLRQVNNWGEVYKLLMLKEE